MNVVISHAPQKHRDLPVNLSELKGCATVRSFK